MRHAPQPEIERQAATIRTIADRWDEMRPDQQKRLLATIFSELAMKDGRLESAKPVPDWMPYFARVLDVPRVGLRGFEPLTS